MSRFGRGATAACLVLAVGLGIGCASTRTQTAARAFADDYFALLQEDRLDAALALCEPGFFDRTPRDEWIAARALVRERLGPIESFVMAKWTMELLPNGTFVTFEYDVVYARGTSRDTLTVVDPVKRPGFRVYGHHVRSDAL